MIVRRKISFNGDHRRNDRWEDHLNDERHETDRRSTMGTSGNGKRRMKEKRGGLNPAVEINGYIRRRRRRRCNDDPSRKVIAIFPIFRSLRINLFILTHRRRPHTLRHIMTFVYSLNIFPTTNTIDELYEAFVMNFPSFSWKLQFLRWNLKYERGLEWHQAIHSVLDHSFIVRFSWALKFSEFIRSKNLFRHQIVLGRCL